MPSVAVAAAVAGPQSGSRGILQCFTEKQSICSPSTGKATNSLNKRIQTLPREWVKLNSQHHHNKIDKWNFFSVRLFFLFFIFAHTNLHLTCVILYWHVCRAWARKKTPSLRLWFVFSASMHFLLFIVPVNKWNGDENIHLIMWNKYIHIYI